jgi:hypothetical protein
VFEHGNLIKSKFNVGIPQKKVKETVTMATSLLPLSLLVFLLFVYDTYIGLPIVDNRGMGLQPVTKTAQNSTNT